MIYKASKNFVLRNIAGESVLVSIGAGVADFRGVIQLNTTAETLWRMLKDGASEEALIKGLTAEYDIDSDTASLDVKETLKMLMDKGMVSCE